VPVRALALFCTATDYWPSYMSLGAKTERMIPSPVKGPLTAIIDMTLKRLCFYAGLFTVTAATLMPIGFCFAATCR
jgi:hypothetical protein